MSVLVGDQILVKGAPDAVLPLCAPVDDAADALEELTKRGQRVLAVARRRLPADVGSPSTAVDAETALQLDGFLASEDPPRQGVADVLRSCRRAGIRVAMITGDYPQTPPSRSLAESVPEIAGLLGHSLPTPAGLAVAVAAIPRSCSSTPSRRG